MIKDFIDVNGTSIYYERDGTGPAILFIAGSTGDAGNFTRTAALLADQFTTVTYDRRGNSRSPPPPDWTTTSVTEQGDDAAALIRALDLAPAVIFGASVGGLIALDLIIRYPQLLRGGILQEPALFSMVPNPAAEPAVRRALLTEALRTSGPRGAVKALMRYLNDDEVFSAIPSDILERMLGNADTIISIEGPGFAAWRPPVTDFGAIRVPVGLLVASGTLPVNNEITGLLARQLQTEPVTVPGRHGFYYYRPRDLADALRPILNNLPSS